MKKYLIIFLLCSIIFLSYIPPSTNWNQKNIGKIKETKNFCFVVIGDVSNNFPAFESFIKSVSNVSFIILNGDLTLLGSNEEYHLMLNFLKRSKIPIIVLPGDNDITSGERMFRKIFGKPYFSFNISKNQFIMLDNSYGAIDVDQYEWLKKELNKNFTRRFLFLHIPILDSNFNYNTKDGEILMTLFKDKNITLISSHTHKFDSFKFKDLNYVITGSCGGYTEEEFSYVKICVNEKVNVKNVKFSRQSEFTQMFYIGFFPSLSILYKAILISILMFVAIKFIKNWR